MSELGIRCIVLSASLALLAYALRRANELFVLEVKARRVVHRRGRIPRQLLEEIRDLVAHGDARGTIRAVARERRPYVIVRGSFSEETTQRLRNVVGLYPLAKVRAGGKPR